MAYLGNVPAEKYISFERQVFTIVNSQTAYTLDHSVTNENDIRLVVNNVVQEPGSGKAYTASGTTLTLSAALVNGTDEMYCVFLGRAVGTVNAPAGSVAASQLASDSVTAAKLNDDIISGQTALASEPADTDEFLISDAGTLKRIDYSLIKGGGITEADQWRLTTTFTGNATPIASNWERQDQADRLQGYLGTGMTESSGIFTFPSTGFWLVGFKANYAINGDDRSINNYIYVTNNNSSYQSTAQSTTMIQQTGSNWTGAHNYCEAIIDVDDVANDKVRFETAGQNSNTQTQGDGNQNVTSVTFIRLADT